MSESTTNPTVKVGDKLAFRTGYGTGVWSIQEVTKISPTGRIACGHYVLDPDLRVRGRNRYSGPFRGEIVTPEILREVKVNEAIRLLTSFKYSDLSDDNVIHLANTVRSMAASTEAKPCS